MKQQTAIIGDVHGDFASLQSLLRRVADRQLVFVGDLVNRGPDSRAVVDRVADLVDAGQAVLVRGNHEVSLLAFVHGTLSFVDFALMGGLPTLKSYLETARGDVREAFRGAFPPRHRTVLECAVDEVVVGGIRVAHWHEDAETALRTGAGTRAAGPVVVGHTVVEVAKRIGDVIFLDSGCGTGGPLSALLLPELTVIAATPEAFRMTQLA